MVAMRNYDGSFQCPKCGESNFAIEYDEPNDRMKITCGRCRYTEEQLPKDAVV